MITVKIHCHTISLKIFPLTGDVETKYLQCLQYGERRCSVSHLSSTITKDPRKVTLDVKRDIFWFWRFNPQIRRHIVRGVLWKQTTHMISQKAEGEKGRPLEDPAPVS